MNALFLFHSRRQPEAFLRPERPAGPGSRRLLALLPFLAVLLALAAARGQAAGTAPTLQADQVVLRVARGSIAAATGTWADPDSPEAEVELEASYGTVIRNADGTWSWEADTRDLPPGGRRIRISAQDAEGNTARGGFFLESTLPTGILSWGENLRGQLGDGARPNPSSTAGAVPGLTDVTALACGSGHVLALRQDGTLWAWGYNADGQLGNGAFSSTGEQGIATPAAVPGLSGIVAVAAGSAHSLALKDDGTVWSWGRNDRGQLGDGAFTESANPTQVPGLTGVVAVAAGGGSSFALKGDGTVWAWGHNNLGQLGTGTATTTGKQSIPTPAQTSVLTGVVAITSGENHGLALKADGTVWAWGSNLARQLGSGTANSATPLLVPGVSGAAAVSAGLHHNLTLIEDGTVMAWGRNDFGQLGRGVLTTTSPFGIATPAPVTGLTDAAGVGGGGSHSLAVQQDRTALAWGRAEEGQLGDGRSGGVATPTSTASDVPGLTGIIAAAGGQFFSTALQVDSLPAPAGFAAAALSPTEIELTWTDLTGEEEYELERKPGAPADPGTYTLVALLGAGATGYTDAAVAPDSQYTYRLRGVDVVGPGAWSAEATATTPEALPEGLTVVEVSGTALDLAWQYAGGETGWEIERASTAGTVTLNAAADARSYSDTGLANNTAYTYRVRAVLSAGFSDWSTPAIGTTGDEYELDNTPATATPLALSPDGTAAEQAHSLHRDGDLDYVSLALNVGDVVEIETFNITGGADTFLRAYSTDGVTELASDDDGGPEALASRLRLAAPETGTFFARVEDADGTGAPGDGYGLRARLLAPDAPGNLVAHGDGTSVVLTWEDNSTNESGFVIERKSGVTSQDLLTASWEEVGNVLANATAYTDQPGTLETFFEYRLRADGTVGPSGWSNVAQATTLAAPQALTAIPASSNRVFLTWEDRSNRELVFKIEWKLESDPESAWGVVATTGRLKSADGVRTYEVKVATPETVNEYRVRASTPTGDSEPSNVLAATPLAAPSALVVHAQGGTVTLSWMDNSAHESEYQLERTIGSDPFIVVGMAPGGSGSGATLTYSDSVPSTDMVYRYRLRAVHPDGYGSHWALKGAYTLATPTGLTATVVNGQSVLLEWTDESTLEGAYRIERKLEAEAESAYVTVGKTDRGEGTGARLSFIAKGLTANTTYHFRVRAYRNENESAPTDAVTVTP